MKRNTRSRHATTPRPAALAHQIFWTHGDRCSRAPRTELSTLRLTLVVVGHATGQAVAPRTGSCAAHATGALRSSFERARAARCMLPGTVAKPRVAVHGACDLTFLSVAATTLGMSIGA
jgi:hypothetical protein